MSDINFDRISRQLFHLQNKIRENPLSVVFDLEQRLNNTQGKIVTLPNGHQLKTREGAAAIEECITFLQRQSPLYPLKWDNKLSLAALDHANDIGQHGIISHQGTNGNTLKQRIEKYGKWKQLLGENMSFGVYDPKEVLFQLLIDDGVQGRGHRNNVFTAAFQVVGIAFAHHNKYHICGVIDYAGQFEEYPSLFPTSPPSQNKNLFSSSAKTQPQPPKSALKTPSTTNKTQHSQKVDAIMSLDIDNIKKNNTPEQPQQSHHNINTSMEQAQTVTPFVEEVVQPIRKKPQAPITSSMKKQSQRDGPKVDAIDNLLNNFLERRQAPKDLYDSQQSSPHQSIIYQTPEQPSSHTSPQQQQYQPQPQNQSQNQTLMSQYQTQHNQHTPQSQQYQQQSSQGPHQSMNQNYTSQLQPQTPTQQTYQSQYSDPQNQKINKISSQKTNDSSVFDNPYLPNYVPSAHSSILVENPGYQSRASEVIDSHKSKKMESRNESRAESKAESKAQSHLESQDRDLDLLIDALYQQVISRQKKYVVVTKKGPAPQGQKQVKTPPKSSENRSLASSKRQLSNPYIKGDREKMRISIDKIDKKDQNPKGSSENPSEKYIKPKKYSGSESVAMSMEKDTDSKKTMSVNPSQNAVNKNNNKTNGKDVAKDKTNDVDKSKGNSNPKDTKQKKVASTHSFGVLETDKPIKHTVKMYRPAREQKPYPLTTMTLYLFGNDLLLGAHRWDELKKTKETDITNYYKQFSSTQEFKGVDETLGTYQYDTYSLFMLKNDPNFLTLCQENYNLFLKGMPSKNKSKWTDIHLPRENLVPYLRSLGFLLDQKNVENIFQLVTAYYSMKLLGTSYKKQTKIVKKESISTLEKKAQTCFNFEGALLAIYACQSMYPNPERLKESLQFFDDKKNGMLNKSKCQEILTTVGEPVTSAEINRFYEEFQDWKAYETQRVQFMKKKGAKSKKQPQTFQSDNLQPEFQLIDAMKVLTMLPY